MGYLSIASPRTMRPEHRRTAEFAPSAPVAGLTLLEATIEDALSEPFLIRVRCLGETGPSNPDDLIGKPVAIRVPDEDPETDDASDRYFHGLVSDAIMEHTETDRTHITFEIRPTLWFLDHVRDCRIFQGVTALEIVLQLCEEHGVLIDATRLAGSYAPREYCVQYNESTLAFIQRILGEDGIAYHFEHAPDRHTLVLGDAPVSYAVESRTASVPWFAGGEAPAAAGHAWGLQDRSRARPREFVSTDYNFELPRADLRAVRQERSAATRGKAQVFDYPGDYADQATGETIARLRLEQLRRDARIVTFHADLRSIAVGSITRLDPVNGGREPRELLITGTKILIRSERDTSTDHVSGRLPYRAEITAIAADQPFRPPWPRRAILVEGPQTATIVGPEGEEIYTDQHGRVKVQFHWDRYGRSDERSSCWIRVSEPWAGKGWGGLQIPRIGQEVIVDFFDGDPDRPVITGRLYNGVNRPPQDLPAGKMISGMRSKTYRGGGHNEISFDDTDGSQKMFVNAQHDKVENVNNNRTTTIGVDSSEEVGNNTLEIVGTDKTIQVGSNTTVTSGQNIVLDAGTSITLKCGASTLTMTSGGVITLSGVMVTVAGAANTNIVAPLTNVAGGVMLNLAGLSANLQGLVTSVGGASLVSVSGGKIDSVADGDQIIKAGGNITLN